MFSLSNSMLNYLRCLVVVLISWSVLTYMSYNWHFVQNSGMSDTKFYFEVATHSFLYIAFFGLLLRFYEVEIGGFTIREYLQREFRWYRRIWNTYDKGHALLHKDRQ